MQDPSRRKMLRSALTGSAALAATAAAARAQGNPQGPEPMRDGRGANILGPRNMAREREEPNTLAPPASDNGDMPNMKWSFADSHLRLQPGGWARDQTIKELRREAASTEDEDVKSFAKQMQSVDARHEQMAETLQSKS